MGYEPRPPIMASSIIKPTDPAAAAAKVAASPIAAPAPVVKPAGKPVATVWIPGMPKPAPVIPPVATPPVAPPTTVPSGPQIASVPQSASVNSNVTFGDTRTVDPLNESEKLRLKVNSMSEDEKLEHTAGIRTKLLDFAAKKTEEKVSDEDIRLAIAIAASTYTPILAPDAETASKTKASSAAKKTAAKPKADVTSLIAGIFSGLAPAKHAAPTTLPADPSKPF